MSESDSFLQEVSEEVRRDQLVATLRKNAVWIALAVIVVVGGAAFFEFTKARNTAAAQANGDALWATLNGAEEGRLDALGALELSDEAAPLLALQTAAAQLDAGDRAAAVASLRGLIATPSLDEPLRDAVRLKLVAVGAGELSEQERLDLLERMVVEGHAMRPLALEQRALIRLASGDETAARADLQLVVDDPLAPQSARTRADQLLTALGPGPEGSDG